MNIFFLVKKALPRARITLTSLFTKSFTLKARPENIPTHRNELKPFTINNLWDNPGSKRKVKRLGRGLGNGKGKTCGKGTKGQRSRAGGRVSHRFEGGQTPLHRRIPKLGMPRSNQERPDYLNLSKLMEFIEKGRLDKSKPITLKDMYDAKVFKKSPFGIKLLARGVSKLTYPIQIEVTSASQQAINLIKDAGGNVTCVYRTKLKLREHLKPEKYPLKLAEPLPPAKEIKKLEKLREMGANVVYNEPLWIKAEKEKEKQIKKVIGYQLPDPKPNSGKDYVRKRKETLAKSIDLKLDKVEKTG